MSEGRDLKQEDFESMDPKDLQALVEGYFDRATYHSSKC